LLALACVAGAASGAHASGLDPFRRTASPRASSTSLDPFRVADAAPAPGAATPAPASRPAAPAPPPAQSCQKDDDCTGDNICENNVCQPIRTHTNIAYLYYREGAFREILLLYWSKRGSEGYTVLAPFYWHFWSPSSESRVVAPFYWRFEDRIKQSVTTVIVPVLPVSWSRWPGGSSFAVWPLFYASSQLGWAVPLLGSFTLHDPATGKSTGAFAFLYWWRRGPQKSFDLLFPVFVSSRSPEHAFTFALPLNIYWRNADDANTLAIPFFYANSNKNGSSFYTLLGYHAREGSEHSGALLWLYWFGGDDKAGTRHDILFPLLWNFGHRDGGTTIVFPLVWSFRGKDSNTTIALPVFYARRGDSSFSTLFPIWWRTHDRATGDGAQLAIPFYFYRRSNAGKSSLLVTLLGGYSRNDEAKSVTWAGLPLLVYHRDPEDEIRMLTPLYVSHTSTSEHATTRLIGLLFYHRADPDGSTTSLFPVFWRFRDGSTGSTATFLFPVFARRSGPRDTSTILLTFYWRSFTNGGWSAGLFPIAFAGKNAEREHAVLFPLFWHFADARASTSTTLAIPLFYWHRDEHGYASAWLPLLFVGRHDGDSYAVQFPLFFHYASVRDGSDTTVTPVGYLHHDRDGTSFGIGPGLPLLYVRSGKERSHFALVPLFWHFADRAADRTTTVVGLYWHRRWGDETTDAFFPFVHYRRGAHPGGTDETSFTLFPFVHYHRDASTRVLVTPLGGSARGPNREGGFVGPFIWYHDADIRARFVPLLYADVTRRATGERTRQYGPWFQIDAPDREVRVLFPLFGHYRDASERDTWVLPTFFRLRRNNGDSVDALLPFYWRSSFGGRETTVVGPWYDRTSPGLHDTGFFPLYFYARNPERTLAVVPPALLIYHHDAASDHTWLWAALLFHSSSKDRRTTAFFPVLYSKREGPRRTDIFFPIYWRFADEDAHRDWILAGPLYSSTAGSRRTRGFLPIAWYTRDPGAGFESNAILPLFYQSSGKDHSSFYTLLAGYRRSGPSHFWYAFPLIFRHKDEVTEATTTVIPPLLYVSRSSPEAGLTTFLGLFWHQHDIASSTTLGLPLFYDVNDYHLSRITVLLPLFVRYARASDDNAWTVAPLFYRHTSPADSTTVAFPLYWDFKTGDNRTTLLIPFFAHWRRPGYTATWVFPSYYYREGINDDGTPDGTYRRFVVPFYDSGVKRPGDFLWEIFGGLVGQERIGRHRYLRLFYMTFETGPAPRAQTSWYSQPIRPPRKSVPRGLNVAGF
jgi:hypothetical protein